MSAYAKMFNDFAVQSWVRSAKLWIDEATEISSWVYGAPAIGEFKNGAFEDGEPWAAYEFNDIMEPVAVWPEMLTLKIEPETDDG